MPVGGALLGESIIEPHSGKMVRVGGASVRAGQLFPNAGGHQALLDSKVQNIDKLDNVPLKCGESKTPESKMAPHSFQ